MTSTVPGLCAAAESAILVGDGERATSLLDEALELADSAAARTDVLCLRGRVALLTGEQSAVRALLRAEADTLESQDETLAARLLTEAAVLGLYGRDAATVDIAQDAYRLAGSAEPLVRTRAAAILGVAYSLNGQPDLGRPYLQQSLDVIRLGGSPQDVVHLLHDVVIGLAGMENYTDALALCRQYTAALRSVGATGLLPLALGLLANTAYFTADFDLMEMAAAETLTLARSQDQQPLEIYANTCLTLVLAVKGESDAARRHGRAALEMIPATGVNTFVPTTHVGLGLVELGAGAWREALEHFTLARTALDGLPTVSGALHWRAEEIEALWRAGEHDAARQRHAAMIAGLENEGPWEHAAAARVGALLADDDNAEALFADAIRWHEQSPSAFERARTELCWGEWLLERGRGPAAEHLQRAADTFAALGTAPWAARATSLLAAAEAAGTTLDAPTTTATTVRAFGPLTLVRDGVETPIPPDAPGRLLRYVVAAGGSVLADQVCEALWPDAPSETAGARLRTVLSRTRARYGPVLVRAGEVIRWADDVTVDVHRFTELARVALSRPDQLQAVTQAGEAISLYRGELMAQDTHSSWAVLARERARARYLALLDLLIDDAVERTEFTAAVNYARLSVEANPLDDQAQLRLVRLLVHDGRWSQAREAVAATKTALAKLGIAEPEELLALEQRITAHQG